MSKFEERIEELNREIGNLNSVPRHIPVTKKVRNYSKYFILAAPLIVWFVLYLMWKPKFVRDEDGDVDGGSVFVYMLLGTVGVAIGVFLYNYLTKGKRVNQFAAI